MSETHCSAAADPAATAPWQWRLGGGRVHRIEASTVARWVSVSRGRLWLTPTRRTLARAGREQDHWLATGQRLRLPPGTEWVAEAWPEAEMALLLEAPPA